MIWSMTEWNSLYNRSSGTQTQTNASALASAINWTWVESSRTLPSEPTLHFVYEKITRTNSSSIRSKLLQKPINGRYCFERIWKFYLLSVNKNGSINLIYRPKFDKIQYNKFNKNDKNWPYLSFGSLIGGTPFINETDRWIFKNFW